MHDIVASTSIKRLAIRAPEGSYDIVLGRGVLPQVGVLAAKAGLGRKVVIASDSNVLPLYGEVVFAALREGGFDPSVVAMSAGERNKNMDAVDLFVQVFLDAGLDRSGWVLALGGGVVGDTAGFAAAIYMRGVDLVQVPTTLLAMADSSVGGKVGVDHPRGKNLLGAFKQPTLVLADPDTLDTLPHEQVAAGMAEVIKAGIIADPELFCYLETNDPASIDYEKAISAAILVKQAIVEEDPHENSVRALLNLGHTFGHAFEKCSGYARLHGEAVAQGMVAAFRTASRLGLCDPINEQRLRAVLGKWGLPVAWGPPDLMGDDAARQVCDAMMSDKKRRDGRLRFVLPGEIGRVEVVSDIPPDLVQCVLMELQYDDGQ